MHFMGMKFIKFSLITASALVAVLSTSCGDLPGKNEYKGPVSSESVIPWNTRLPGEGEGALGGLGGGR